MKKSEKRLFATFLNAKTVKTAKKRQKSYFFWVIHGEDSVDRVRF